MEPVTEGPRSEEIARIGDLTGRRPTGFRRAAGGYTPAERWVVELEGGDRVFAKIGVDARTAGWLRDEHRAYSVLAGEFMPRLRGWDDGERPLLLLEDLSRCFWPPPWDASRVDQVLEALAALRAVDAAGVLPPVGELTGGWRQVAADPEPFLSLGLATGRWLRDHAPVLVAAADEASLDGPSPAHLDVRSDNLCFRGGRAVLVDWNHAVLAHPDLDIAGWAPSLHAEGGPPPEQILPGAGPLAAVISGYFAEKAGQPLIPTAPRVRDVQRRQLRTALPWAVRALGLATLDGPAAGGEASLNPIQGRMTP